MSSFQNICSLPLSSDLFTQALHPSLPLLSVGLSSGHVQSFKLPPVDDPSQDSADPPPEPRNEGPTKPILRRSSTASAASESGLGEVETAWRTKRHKGSCRCVAFSQNGEILYSAGTDGLVKAALSESGQVVSKIAIPLDDGDVDPPALIQSITPQTLLLSTDSSALYIYDLRSASDTSSTLTISSKPSQTHHPHPDYVSSITPLPALESKHPKQFVTTGSTTLAVTDLRQGVIVQSEDQEQELTSSTYIDGLKTGGTSRGQKIAIGGSDGVLTLWEKGVWDDQDERIVVDGQGAEIEQLIKVPETVSMQGQQKLVAAGLDDGRVRFIRLGPNKIVKNWDVKHDDLEGVTGLGFDIGGRMVTGGGQIVNVWRLDTPEQGANGIAKRPSEGSDDDEKSSEDDNSDQEDRNKPTKRRKRKRVKGKDRSGTGQVMAFHGLE